MNYHFLFEPFNYILYIILMNKIKNIGVVENDKLYQTISEPALAVLKATVLQSGKMLNSVKQFQKMWLVIQ